MLGFIFLVILIGLFGAIGAGLGCLVASPVYAGALGAMVAVLFAIVLGAMVRDN